MNVLSGSRTCVVRKGTHITICESELFSPEGVIASDTIDAIERNSLDAPVEIRFEIYEDTIVLGGRKTAEEKFAIDNFTAEIIVESVMYTYDSVGPVSTLRSEK